MTEETPLGKRFETIGNCELSDKALDSLNRMNVRALDEDEIDAYTDALQGLAYLSESLSEPERQPNAKVDWGEPDDD